MRFLWVLLCALLLSFEASALGLSTSTSTANRAALDGPAGVADVTDPVCTTFSPVDNATGVLSTVDLVLTCDEVVVAVTGDCVLTDTGTGSDITTFTAITDAGSGDGQYQISGTTVTFHPDGNLLTTGAGVGYDMQCAATFLDDTSGNSWAGISNATTWNFTTDGAEPTLVASTPTDNATDVAINTNIVLQFSETVVFGTGDIDLNETGVGSHEAFDVSVPDCSLSTTSVTNDTVTCNPASDLSNDTGYDVQVDATAIDDLSGNSYAGIGDATTLNFTTVAAAAGIALEGAVGQTITGSSSADITLPGTPVENDVILFICASDSATVAVNTTGYNVADIVDGGAGNAPASLSGYKVMTSTPDTVINITAGAGRDTPCIVHTYSGVDTSNVLDVATTGTTGTTGMPNPTEIDPVTNNAWVVALGFLDDDNVVDGSAPSGFINFSSQTTSEAADQGATVLIATKLVTDGAATNPDAFGGSGSDGWVGVSVALRPAS